MAKRDTETELLRAVAGAFPQSADRLRGQVEILATLTNVQNDRIRDNTDAITQNTSTRGSGGSQAASVTRSVLGMIGGGLFLSPLVNGIARLFRGSREDVMETVIPAARPASVNLQAASFSDGSTGAFDFDQYGKPRQVAPARVDFTALTNDAYSNATSAGLHGVGNNGKAGPASPEMPSSIGQTNVTIQIQALDSRSILDRSDEIARALREAMLNSHAVNDVISEG